MYVYIQIERDIRMVEHALGSCRIANRMSMGSLVRTHIASLPTHICMLKYILYIYIYIYISRERFTVVERALGSRGIANHMSMGSLVHAFS